MQVSVSTHVHVHVGTSECCASVCVSVCEGTVLQDALDQSAAPRPPRSVENLTSSKSVPETRCACVCAIYQVWKIIHSSGITIA